MRTFRGRCTSAAAELLLIVVCVAGVLLARCPGGEPPKQAAVKSNNACYVCHMPFIEEPLAADHAKVHVWCGTCHGPSIAHVEDENIGATPPDTVFKKDRIDRMCGQCHDPEEHTPLSTKTRASHLAKSKQAQRKIKGRKVKVTGVCTDCHGHHWIPPREPDVDTKTGSQDRRQGGSSRSKLIAMHDGAQQGRAFARSEGQAGRQDRSGHPLLRRLHRSQRLERRRDEAGAGADGVA